MDRVTTVPDSGGRTIYPIFGEEPAMPEVALSAGVVEYTDTEGGGPVIVFLHGLLMDGSLWEAVVEDLRTDYRCVVPTLPLGGHRRPMNEEADLTLPAMARLVAEFLERVALADVTLVGNDWGGAQLLISEGCDERVGRIVITSSEAFDNYPPGLPGRTVEIALKVPGGLYGALASLRVRPLRRLPFTYGWMSKRLPDELLDAWIRPALGSREIRRDLRKYGAHVPPKATLMDWAQRQASFDRPVLVAWASEDKVMPPEHGRRLAAMFPQGRLVEIGDSYTLIPIDQPAVLAGHIRTFIEEAAATAA
jgi:pimeloyl-ACP methyl ester carboxylesterase